MIFGRKPKPYIFPACPNCRHELKPVTVLPIAYVYRRESNDIDFQQQQKEAQEADFYCDLHGSRPLYFKMNPRAVKTLNGQPLFDRREV